MAPRLAYFISSHGFGHAARACGVVEALWRRAPQVRVELFTATPRWFFELSLDRPFGHHAVATDLGLVQKSSLEEDLRETVRQLRAWVPFRRERLEPLLAAVGERSCDLVVCDVAPIGLEVARRLGLPSLLVENFTWDWIYRAYAREEPALLAVADELEAVFAGAGRRIQTEPVCREVDGALRVAPVSRAPRSPRAAVRRRLDVPDDARLVMVTMGGIEWDYRGIDAQLAAATARDRWLVVPGGSRTPRTVGRAVLLPHRSDHYHPDLIHAADAVVGKLGYSTVAEVHAAGVPFGYVPRPTFPESPPVEAWVRSRLPARRIEPGSFASWAWLDDLDPVLELPRNAHPPPDGGDDAARVVLEMLGLG